MNDNKTTITALVFSFLMIISPMAGAANVNTFSNGDSEVTVEVRDGPDYQNIQDGEVTLPAGDTVTSASMTISTDMATHQTHNTINVETKGQFLWDPEYNNYQTEYSNKNLFTYGDDSIKLVSGGFSTDFEGTTAGFMDISDNEPGWEHGILQDGTVLNSNCNTGDECWGTNIYDFDNDYTSDETSAFSRSMITPAMEVNPQAFIAKFSSWHGFHYNVSGANNYYYDCGYVMVRNSTTTSFPPPNIDSSWSYIPFDAQNSTGVGYSNGLYPVGIGNGRIQNCDSLTGVDYALGGESTSPTLNPTGWAQMALNLEEHAGKYVQLKFVMKHNARPNVPENMTMPGWFIDDFRIGNPLPQSGWMTVKGFTPKQSPSPGFPDGYGILYLEQETSPTNFLTATILNAGTTEIVVDTNGNQMTGLEGPIIELWDIDSNMYPIIDIRLEFDTGQYRLSTSTLHGITMGTRVGTGLNDTSGIFNEFISNGVWNTPGSGDLIVYEPILGETIYGESVSKTKFSKPIVSVTPVVVDNCIEDPAIGLIDQDQTISNLTVGQRWVPDDPIFRFSSIVSYTNPCDMSELWFDLEFGHNAEAVSIDVANDGDLEWAMNHPAFGHFGRQTKFWAGASGGINYAMDSSTVLLSNINGEGSGGIFMLPVGAEIQFAEITMRNNTIGEFDISLRSGTQEYGMGTMENQTLLTYNNMFTKLPFKDALQSLLANPLVGATDSDEFGNQWIRFDFKLSNPNASVNSDITLSDLDILYKWEATINENQFLDRELNQGISLGTGNQVPVPIALSANSGGAINLSDLQITTSSGYDSSLSLVGNPVGFYPNGDIIEAVSIHSVAQSTGAAFAEARLRMESTSGLVELSFSELSLFNEVHDPDNLVTLESSSYTNVGDEVHVTWRFKVNPTWEDSAQLRIYASLIADNGVNGLPSSFVLAPVGGNAIENDAMIASFELRNNGGELQNLTSATSNQNFNLMGTIRLEGLDVAPDPTLYNLSLQRWDVQSINGTIVSEWIEVRNMSGVIGGNFDWDIDLGLTAVAQASYRFVLDGYNGGDTLCPPSPIVSDADCAIPFNLTLDTYSPTLINISMLKNVGDDASNWDNWRNLVDDTWVKPNSQQKVRLLAQDIPEPPNSLDLYYWVEYDHDTDFDGIADPDEYVMMTLQSDGELPTANYSGAFSDDANKGQDPPGKVSIYVEGADIGGNPIDGGMPGFDNDLVTYVSMDAKTPSIRNFFIEDSDRNRLHNPAEGAPFYQGPWNMTMYAGNQYHLIVEATDENGWRDIEYFEIGLGPEDMVIYYSPRNETAWTDSTDIEIVEASNESDGPQVLRMDGGRLVDAFEDEFYLDLPIRMNWDIIGIGGGTMIPDLRIKDEGEDRIVSIMTESGGRHKQRWVYSDGIQLDFRNGITPTFTDMVSPYTQDLNVGFVFPGDIVQMEGQYAYVDGINFEVYVLPEGEFTLEITRLEASTNTDNGYVAYPAGGADGTRTDGPTLHKINGGAFNINITAPSNTNEYTYTFRLVDLPTGAVDSTAAICDGNNVNGCGTFKIKVDGKQPEVEDDKWEATSGLNGEVFGNTMPSSSLHCVDVEAVIEENAALIAGEVNLFWSFYLDAENNQTWPVYGQKFGIEPQVYPLDLNIKGGDYIVSADCVDLWPDPVDPTQAQLSGVDVILWIEGRDSAGWGIKAGGPFTKLDGSEGVSGIYSSNPIHNSEYRLVYEEASFKVIDVRMTPKNPEVGQTPELEITLKNDGTKDGNITLEIQSVKDGGFPTTELTFTTEDIPMGTTENIFVTDLEVFGTPTSGMYFIIVDADSNIPLWNGSEFSKSFNVAEASNDDGFLSGSGMLIVIGLSALILILLLAVVVLARRGSEDGTYEYEYEYEDEVDKSVVDLPRAGPPSAGPPPASVDPVMAAALAEFPQWDQATIQGYFDQGWDINSLRDWVNNNQ